MPLSAPKPPWRGGSFGPIRLSVGTSLAVWYGWLIMAPKATRSETRARYFIRAEAGRRGWNLDHPSRGGDFLEENEIVAHFKDIGLGQDKPDFLLTLSGQPAAVVEAKNSASKADEAIGEAIEYASA